MNLETLNFLKKKSSWVRKETLRIHGISPETRLASSLSCVEILSILYYGNIIKFDAKNINWEGRDRLIISKGHGSISFFPILADLGYFPKEELDRVGKEGTFLGGIPDCIIPGYETTNGSLGHGLGVACGIAIALKEKKSNSKVFVLVGDGELHEGSNWEAIMFASHHNLDNLILIVDKNGMCMLDYCNKVINMDPLENKFKAFGWKVKTINGHDIEKTYNALDKLKKLNQNQPKVLIAVTQKGKGVPRLEVDPLCHIKVVGYDEINDIIRGME